MRVSAHAYAAHLHATLAHTVEAVKLHARAASQMTLISILSTCVASELKMSSDQYLSVAKLKCVFADLSCQQTIKGWRQEQAKASE